MEDIVAILDYIVESFIHIWPYLLVTIPIAVAVQMSGASKYIRRAFSARPIIAIILASFVGAFSPLCSCSVVPVVAAMLIGGVPLAPVMSFWLASPSMDPEIFFLTVGTLGWDLAIWRLATTLILSLGAGFLTYFLTQCGWLGKNILRKIQTTEVKTLSQTFRQGIKVIDQKLRQRGFKLGFSRPPMSSASASCSSAECAVPQPATVQLAAVDSSNLLSLPTTPADFSAEPSCSADSTCGESTSILETRDEGEASFWARLAKETWLATSMVIKFMLLAWLIGALINLYVPEQWITQVLGGDNPWSILTAALLGIPVYTSNLTAMPLIGGLLTQGMHPAAALAFLIAGPMTTLPAMSAVWGLVNRKVFSLNIGFALIGAVVMGYAYFIALSI